IKKNPLLKGVTFSGGEPFCQAKELIYIAKKVKEMGKDIWCYSGYTYEELQKKPQPFSEELLDLVDVLVDGKFILEQRDLTLKFKGSKNQRIIDCEKTRKIHNITLYNFE
ncbi:MAG: 4Fe-4S single cluster domain-containing protein, partial [Oscillospiraceae bacterium]